MWRKLIQGLSAEAALREPATASQIASTGRAVSVALPDQLVTLLSDSNGVRDQYGFDIVWSCEELISENRVMRDQELFGDLFMPFDSLLFFGGAGDGDLFAYAIINGRVRDDWKIFRWDHETDSRTVWAFGLQQFFQRTLTPDNDRWQE